MNTMNQQRVDARGLNCPLPILRLKKAVNAAASGEYIELLSTDPGSVKDVEAFCKQTGNELVACNNLNDGFQFQVRKP